MWKNIFKLSLLLGFPSVALTTGFVISGFKLITFLIIVFFFIHFFLPRAKALVEELSLLTLEFR